MMGRIYDIYPDTARGERSGKGKVFFLDAAGEWHHLPFVTRIEFFGDTDEGNANVTVLWNNGESPIINPSTGKTIKQLFTGCVRFEPKCPVDQPHIVHV